VLIKVGDDVSTDEILPAGARALPYRSNIPEIARFAFEPIDPAYYERAVAQRGQGHFIVAGKNYGQGSSREHAALAPRFLGARAVLALGFARIHQRNLINFGILPLVFEDPADYDRMKQGDELEMADIGDALRRGGRVRARHSGRDLHIDLQHDMSPRQIEQVLAGGVIPLVRRSAQL
jgi:aconitate hydratase